ncbi:hypothetical protein Y032_0121g1023 [Ancylostoma ceylanicum]|uniref:ER lumen protein-retaining receptor n=1 Tax=Ancylostoma ceylanicum TaxID=53326 RepID=A0A016TAF7_9BILA|nr:hypothetical protein Y032_0121g1023 [Ancylostoma ceylanicum]
MRLERRVKACKRGVTMNIFRLTADMSHLVAIFILLAKMWKTRSVSGISARSQILFAIVFTTRYLDLFTTFISTYNTVMKVFFIISSYGTLYLMLVKFRPTYEKESDSFRVEFLLIPCVLLSFLINHEFTPMEILWTFSIYLEAVAIMPQLFMLQATGSAETITAHYLFALGSYRALYLLNWIYRYARIEARTACVIEVTQGKRANTPQLYPSLTRVSARLPWVISMMHRGPAHSSRLVNPLLMWYYTEAFFDPIATVAGVVQTVLYADFFYLYVTRVVRTRKAMELPI